MEYFDKYTSNTIAGGGNQHFFLSDGNEQRGRIFYKVYKGGKFNYSFLFSNIIDSTFADGSVSHKNLICDEWEIVEAKVGVCDYCDCEKMTEIEDVVPLTFNGEKSKTVMAGGFFYSDEVEIEAEKDSYLCLEIAFKGKMIPYHEESILPIFRFINGEWDFSKQVPIPSMVGCDRKVLKRVGFLGDSITQGIGVEANSYEHWNAKLIEMTDDEYSYWNLGLGFGRADDAASNGAWLFKAKQTDKIVLCFGVNDIMQGFSIEQIKRNLRTIVEKLKESNVDVLIQTVPPFDYNEEKTIIWNEVNRYIKEELSKECYGFFDTVKVLGKSEDEPQMAKYGGHPDANGCTAWAEALYPMFKEFIKK